MISHHHRVERLVLCDRLADADRIREAKKHGLSRRKVKDVILIIYNPKAAK